MRSTSSNESPRLRGGVGGWTVISKRLKMEKGSEPCSPAAVHNQQPSYCYSEGTRGNQTRSLRFLPHRCRGNNNRRAVARFQQTKGCIVLIIVRIITRYKGVKTGQKCGCLYPPDDIAVKSAANGRIDRFIKP